MAGSSSEIVDRLAKAPLRARLLVLGVVLGVLGALYYYSFYTDLAAEEEGLHATNQRLVEQERVLLKRKNDYQALLKQKAEVEERLKRNAVKLPESSELPAFFQHLEAQAATAGVKMVSRSLEKELAVETYVKVPVRMEIQGDFYQIKNYFKLLHETPRIITIEDLDVGSGRRDGERLVLVARFTASTFRQADRPPSAPPAAGDSAPAVATPRLSPTGTVPPPVPASMAPPLPPPPSPPRGAPAVPAAPAGAAAPSAAGAPPAATPAPVPAERPAAPADRAPAGPAAGGRR